MVNWMEVDGSDGENADYIIEVVQQLYTKCVVTSQFNTFYLTFENKATKNINPTIFCKILPSVCPCISLYMLISSKIYCNIP